MAQWSEVPKYQPLVRTHLLQPSPLLIQAGADMLVSAGVVPVIVAKIENDCDRIKVTYN